jgi:Domain of unknown function (DUF6134)
MTRRNSLLLVVAGLLATAGVSSAVAGDAGEYTFTVRKDGSPVGHHCIVFQRQGDRVEIREATEIEVRLAMIPIYRFEHEGTEVWEDGRALRIDGTTNDNGEKLDIAVRRNADGYTRMINGRVDEFDDSKQVLSFWSKDVVNHENFFSVVEDKIIKASFEFVDRERITVAGQGLEVDHYRMAGDEERDLWFDRSGRIAKVAFSRLGSEITYLRDQIAPLKSASNCVGAPSTNPETAPSADHR